MTNTLDLIEAELQHVQGANGVSYAYRRLGRAGEGVPLVFLQHFRGDIDNWDPALVDPIAAERDVILFDNVGIGASTGAVPSTVEEMARDAIAFIEALDLAQVDLFGFSLGGFVAQAIALGRPAIARRLILAGTGAQGAPGMGAWSREVADRLVLREQPGGEDLLYVFYAHTPSSQGAGQASLGRIFQRQEGRDTGVTLDAKDAQYKAIVSWGDPDEQAEKRLAGIAQPTLILQGDNDIMIPTTASHTLAEIIPNSRITIFPDASHGSIFQYATEAAAETVAFLAE
ncbi:MAG: alpha/beta hydrolase [Microbacteriaceae bacterium]|nr:alpha/beta hydrolase [Microbacteriaceae bacterium]